MNNHFTVSLAASACRFTELRLLRDVAAASSKENLARTLKLAYDRLGIGLVVNNSSRPAVGKPESDDQAPFLIEPKSVVLPSLTWRAVDGVITGNTSQGRIAKCPDANVVVIHEDGDVTCFGPRESFPFFGVGALWKPDANALGSNWQPAERMAEDQGIIPVRAPDQPNGGSPGGNGGGGRGEHHMREVFRGDINIDREVSRTV